MELVGDRPMHALRSLSSVVLIGLSGGSSNAPFDVLELFSSRHRRPS